MAHRPRDRHGQDLERHRPLQSAHGVLRVHELGLYVGIVVHDDGELAGVLSQRDLFLGGLLRALGYGAHAKAQALATMVVKDAMVADPHTTTPRTPLAEAEKIMLRH